jgi:hypothetical protein
VSSIIIYTQGRTKNGKTIYDRLGLKNKIEKEDFEEYSIDISDYNLNNSYEQKLLVSHLVLNRIYEFKLNIPTIKEAELNNGFELEDIIKNNQESDNNFLDFILEFINRDTNTGTYYLKDNFNPIRIFPQQRNDLVNYNFSDKYYRNLIFQNKFYLEIWSICIYIIISKID